MAQRKAGKRSEARATLRRILDISPASAKALHLLGVIALEEGNAAQAEEFIRKAIGVAPNIAAFHSNLGVALKNQGRFEEAAAAYRRAVELRPDYAEAYNNLGAALADLERYEEAVVAYCRAIEIKPGYAHACNNLGAAFNDMGRFDEALAAYRRAIELKPDYAAAYRHLGKLKRFRPNDPDLAAMERLAGSRTLSELERAQLFSALGKGYEDIGDYDKAFQFIFESNQCKRRTYVFSIEEFEKRVGRIKAAFNAEFLDSVSGAGCPSDVPIFIVGMPRSGTTLVEQILASHPAVHGAGELKDIGLVNKQIRRWVDPSSTLPFPECVGAVAREGWRSLGESYVEKLRKLAPGAVRVTDKMPFNFLWVGLIHAMLPKAPIVHLERNPLDTCLSCYKHYFVEGCEFSNDLTELGRYYRIYRDVMTHWHQVLPGRVLNIRYEDLVDDLAGNVRRLIAYCGLEWSEACLRFYETQRPVQTPSASQVRQPIYKSSVALWRRYEHHLAPLIRALGPLAGQPAADQGSG